MSTMVAEIYDALRTAGIDEPLARAATMAEMKADLLKWNISLLVIMTGMLALMIHLG